MTEIRFVQVAEGVSFFVPQKEGALFSEVDFIYNEIFSERTYLRHGITLPDDARVIDAGANVGVFTVFVKQHAPNASMLAFEPIPAIHDALARNIEANDVTGVTVHRLALGGQPETGVHFTFYPSIPGNSTRYPEQKKYAQDVTVAQIGQPAVDEVMTGIDVEVEVVRLSDMIARWAPDGPIDLLKVDVEGAELDVLQGLDDADWARIRQCVLEVQDLDGRLDRIVGILRGQGFSVLTEAAVGLPEVFRYFMVYATRPTD